jgi:N-sulfoglucosamine sulfohydrolase
MKSIATAGTALILTVINPGLSSGMPGPERRAIPCFLLIMADDCTYNDLPLYGGKNARTPNIDRLAREGLTFNQAYLAEAMCQPCRAELYTGLYPLSNGCAWNHAASRPGIASLPDYLRPLGYRVGLAGKVHVAPEEVYDFDMIEGFEDNCVRNPTRPHQLDGIASYMAAAKNGHPFCLVVALVEPHVPWVMGDASAYPAGEINLPPHFADTPETRSDFSRYLAEITFMDEQVGEILAALKEAGAEDHTLVLFTSEQGAQFPGCKWTNYNTGIHTALIARWPGMINPGQRTNALVQYADITPTLVELAGGNPGEMDFDGGSFVDVFHGKQAHRQFVYSMHNNLPEGPPYPIRSITDGRFHYILNLLPGEIYIEKHLMAKELSHDYWDSWVGDDPLTRPESYRMVKRYMRRPPEELYLTTKDPFELDNLADDPEYQEIRKELSRALDEWMEHQQDPGEAVDTREALEAARKGKHLHGRIVDSIEH